MRRETKVALVSRMTELLGSQDESVRMEAARIVLAVEGILLPVSEGLAAQQLISDRLKKRQEIKRIQNRRAYIKRRLKTLQQERTVNSTAITTEDH